jgi:integrase/recombinase XerD
MVTIFRRHNKNCPHKADRYSKRCDCKLWFQFTINGHQRKMSAKTRSWEQANKLARKKEDALDRGVFSEAVPVQQAPMTVAQAREKYLADKKVEGRTGRSALRKHINMTKRLLEWCNAHGIVFLKDITADNLKDWRNTWTFKRYGDNRPSYSWKIHWAVSKAFFKHAFTFGWIPTNEAEKLNGFKVEHEQIQPFTREEMTKILASVDGCFNPEEAHRMRSFILLMRWSGLACRDAATLERAAMDNGNRIRRRRGKTNTFVFVPIPPFVGDSLRQVENSNPKYFFWNGTSQPDTLVGEFQRKLQIVFKAAGVSGHSHQFRHTFAVENLLAGMSIEDVSRLLGHTSLAVTQKHYDAFIQARQAQLERVVTEAWAKMEAH